MIASSISPTQPAQSSPAVGKAEELHNRRRAAEHEDNRTSEIRNVPEQQAQAQGAAAQHANAQENVKPSVNTNGQTLGRVINTTA
jgi:hypothetical protein